MLRRIDKTEFFWENPQMLGFSNPSRATVMVVKEVIDNALDACEDISVLPEIKLKLTADNSVFHLEIQDNGSGIPDPKQNVPRIFGELLYGSKFGTYKQTRGQQGIGVSAAFLWSQKTVGEPVRVITKYIDDDQAHEFLLTTKGKGKLKILSHNIINNSTPDHGTFVSIKFKGSWRSKSHLLHYLESTALSNPEANIEAIIDSEHIIYNRTTDVLPRKPIEIKPHPHSADIGMIEELISKTKARKLKNFLYDTFSSFGDNAIKELNNKLSFSLDLNPRYLKKQQIRELVDVLKTIKFRAPSSNCLVPLGTDRIISTLMRYNPEFCHAVTRDMQIYDGHPFIVEVGIAYGGNIKGLKYFRLANRVPLIYDEGNCALTEGVKINYKNYRIKQRDDGFPDDNMILLVHLCSTHVPYSTQAKTFVAHKDVIINEIRLALQQVLRKVSTYINKKTYHVTMKKEIDERLNIACRLYNKVSEILEVSDEPAYISIAKISKSLFYDDENNVLINTLKEPVKVNDISLQPGEKLKLDYIPEGHFIITKSKVDKLIFGK